MMIFARTLFLLSFYYLTSIGLTFYQNWLMKKISFPLCVVLIHFMIKFHLAALSRHLYTCVTGIQRITLGLSDFFSRVAIVAIVASMDIGLSQWSFEFIEVALYTITKSTSIVFILFFAIVFGLEKKHWSLIVIVLVISCGLIMFTYESTDFSFVGFIMALTASFLSGIRWTFSQLIMQKSDLGLSNPLDMVFHVQPLMIISLLPFAILIEGPSLSSHVSMAGFTLVHDLHLWKMIGFIMGGGVIAFLMEVAEFMVVNYTSSLTLAISGILKEIVCLALAVLYQSTQLSIINMAGLVVCLLGVILHVLRKVIVDNEGKNRRHRQSQLSTQVSICSEKSSLLERRKSSISQSKSQYSDNRKIHSSDKTLEQLNLIL